ncbi:MAG: hypothetical protein E6G60_05990, partial [Actinobacteria bacterium]
AVADVKGVRTVYFGSGNTLYALRADDGRVRWRRALGSTGANDPGEIESSPVVAAGMVIVGTDVHNDRGGHPAGVYALDAATGRQRWFAQLAPRTGEGATGSGCGDVWGSASVDAGRRLVFVGTGNCVSSPAGWGRFAEAMVALSLDDGTVRWTYQPHAPNLFEANGRALVGLGNKDAVYYAVDRETGELVWKTKVAEPGLVRPGSNFSTGGFIGPTAVADGVIAGGTAVGGAPFLHALDAATGKLRWQQPIAAATYGASAVANGVLFVGGTDFTFRALDLQTGRVLWSSEMTGAVSGGSAVVGADVYAVAGIREPGQRKRSETSGVTKFSVHGRPVTSTPTRSAPSRSTRPPRSTAATVRRHAVQRRLQPSQTTARDHALDDAAHHPRSVEGGRPRAGARPGVGMGTAGKPRRRDGRHSLRCLHLRA